MVVSVDVAAASRWWKLAEKISHSGSVSASFADIRKVVDVSCLTKHCSD
jgi:hypothetical protein